jgi:biopolymer transport protein ExbD
MIVVNVIGSLMGSLVAIMLTLLVIFLTIVQMLVENSVSALNCATGNAKSLANDSLHKVYSIGKDMTAAMTSRGKKAD